MSPASPTRNVHSQIKLPEDLGQQPVAPVGPGNVMMPLGCQFSPPLARTCGSFTVVLITPVTDRANRQFSFLPSQTLRESLAPVSPAFTRKSQYPLHLLGVLSLRTNGEKVLWEHLEVISTCQQIPSILLAKQVTNGYPLLLTVTVMTAGTRDKRNYPWLLPESRLTRT